MEPQKAPNLSVICCPRKLNILRNKRGIRKPSMENRCFSCSLPSSKIVPGTIGIGICYLPLFNQRSNWIELPVLLFSTLLFAAVMNKTECYGGSVEACSPRIPQFVFGTSWIMTCTWSAVTPISTKTLVMPLISAAFCSSLFPDQVSTMITGKQCHLQTTYADQFAIKRNKTFLLCRSAEYVENRNFLLKSFHPRNN